MTQLQKAKCGSFDYGGKDAAFAQDDIFFAQAGPMCPEMNGRVRNWTFSGGVWVKFAPKAR
jgi:hypothetical protein